MPFFISPLSGRRKQTTSVRFFFLLYSKLKGGFLKILCCHEDTWFHLNLTFLKPWANQCIVRMEMFLLSCVNETKYLLWTLPYFEMVPLKTNFFLFSNLGLIIAQQTSIHIHCFMAGGWHTSCHPVSKMHIVEEGPGETPSAMRCLSYLINNFLTDIKQLLKLAVGLAGGHSPFPFWCLCQKHSLSPFIL